MSLNGGKCSKNVRSVSNEYVDVMLLQICALIFALWKIVM
jgi:hypothetical protein